MKAKSKRNQARRRHIESPCVSAEEYLTRAEIAARLRRHLSSVNLLIKRRYIPYYKIGRHIRFKWSEVEAQLQQHCRIAPN